MTSNPRWRDWLKQAQAEMAMKALGYYRGADIVKGQANEVLVFANTVLTKVLDEVKAA